MAKKKVRGKMKMPGIDVTKFPDPPKPEKPKVGRPNDYHPDYPKMLLDHMSQGYSFETFAAIIDVVPSTIYLWVEKYPEFSDAKRIGHIKAKLKWETIGNNGIYNMEGISINPTVYRMNMINRFKWKDKAEDDKKISLDLEKLTDEELNKKIAELEGQKDE